MKTRTKLLLFGIIVGISAVTLLYINRSGEVHSTESKPLADQEETFLEKRGVEEVVATEPLPQGVTLTLADPAAITAPVEYGTNQSGEPIDPATYVPEGRPQVVASYNMYEAHAPLRHREVADPDSDSNKQILEAMVLKAFDRSSRSNVSSAQ